MKIAVLSDIHGILPAVETALALIDAEGVDETLVAGDMVAGPQPVEVVARLRERNCIMIRGNNEEYLLRMAAGDCPAWWLTCHQWGFMQWNARAVDRETLDFLDALPEQLVYRHDGFDPIRMLHGSPTSNSELIYPDEDMAKLDAALALIAEPAAIFGHTHEAWQTRRSGKLAVNPGSVSMSFDGHPGGNYAVLSWEGGQWSAKVHHFEYDLQLMREAYERSGLLEQGGAFARCGLRSIEDGLNYLPAMLDFAYRKAAEAGYADSPFVPDVVWDRIEDAFEEELSAGRIEIRLPGKV